MWRPSKDFDLWNFKNTEAPSTNTCKTDPEHLDIKYLRTVAEEGLTFFKEENFLYAETQVLTRIIYRMKKKFRSSKDFKSMERLNRLLTNYFSLNIKCSLQRFVDLIPRIVRNNEVYLPTKNMLDFILVRLQGLSKLMERVVESTKICGYLFNVRIRTGHFWKLGFILFAIVSRIHVLARHIIRFMCQFYNKLVPFSNKLRNTGDSWLPDNYNLPKKLDQWLEVDWLSKDDDVIEVEAELPRIIQYFDLLDDDDEDIEFCDEYVLVNDTIKTTLEETDSIKQDECKNLRGFDSDEDIGEVIVSESKGSNKNKNDSPTHYPSEAVSRDNISSDDSSQCIAALSDQESSGDSISEDDKNIKSKKQRAIFKTCGKLKRQKNDRNIVVLSDSDESEESKNLSDSDVSIISAQSFNNRMKESSSDESEIVFEKEPTFNNDSKKRKVVLKRNLNSKKLKTDVVELSDSEKTESITNSSIASLESSVILLNDSIESPKKPKVLKKKLKTPKKLQTPKTMKNTVTGPSKKKKRTKVVLVPDKSPKTSYHSETIKTQKNINQNASVSVLDKSSLVAAEGSTGAGTLKHRKSNGTKNKRKMLRKAKFLEKKQLQKLKKKQLKNKPISR